jgi:hypothetical protein
MNESLVKEGWQEYGKKEGITIYNKKQEGLNMVRSEGIMPYNIEIIMKALS